MQYKSGRGSSSRPSYKSFQVDDNYFPSKKKEGTI